MRLEPVTAQFWHTSVTTRGGIEGKAGTKGKIFSLDVSVTRAWPASSRFPLDLTDFKSFLLGAGDLFFKKKNVGAVIPIKIEGTKDSPSFGLNL